MANVTHIVKRNGKTVEFDRDRIFSAISKAFLSDNQTDISAVERITNQVIHLVETLSERTVITVEEVQDHVEETLMKNGYLKIAKNYILYREKHKQAREEAIQTKIREKKLHVLINDSESVIYDPKKIENTLRQLAPDLMKISITEMVEAISRQVYDNIPKKEIDLLILGVARERIERHYQYSLLASRLSINNLYLSILGEHMNEPTLDTQYKAKFSAYIQKGIELEMLSPDMAGYNMETIAAALQPKNDQLFHYMGTQILMDRYFLRDRSKSQAIYELPQWFWMRVAMGLALKETDKEAHAIEFYTVLSNMDLVSSTPTLFNSGTLHSQMSSCYLNLAKDSLTHIFKLFSDNAQLSKWAGGIGTDWTYVRATGSQIRGTNGRSQGVIPFIKIFNDVALAVNQGGKRKGAMCAYMEVWHADFEQFLELKKNTGDERRRAHDINTAGWIPDLFMKRVLDDGNWTLFCPSEVTDLHDIYGAEFEKRYEFYESQKLSSAKTLKAKDLWRKMLTMLFETGHPWITFKDSANVRNPQDHVGVIHSSNLCTEITLNTSEDETAVCNLASVNLANMITNGQLDRDKINRTVTIGIRMLDNVIDNNYYPTEEAKKANLRHRAIGLGMMGYQDALYKLNIPFESDGNIEFADKSMEMISFYAIKASAMLAKERGAYESFKGSKWDRGIFPYDTLDILQKERGRILDVDRSRALDWTEVYSLVNEYGMRNSNTMAIAPTATIANISGVFPCTEPAYRNIYMKENLSGNFIVVNRYLLDDLDRLNLWNSEILGKIKLNDGSIAAIYDIPESIRNKYKETFEIEAKWIIECASRRSKWIDQSASTNVFLKTSSGKHISDTYLMAWEKGLKTTYYLRTLGASQITKATVQVEASAPSPEPTTNKVLNAQSTVSVVSTVAEPTCEACE